MILAAQTPIAVQTPQGGLFGSISGSRFTFFSTLFSGAIPAGMNSVSCICSICIEIECNQINLKFKIGRAQIRFLLII